MGLFSLSATISPALFPKAFRSLVFLAAMGIVAGLTLAACGSDPEPTAVPVAATGTGSDAETNTGAASPPAGDAAEQPQLVFSPPAEPADSAPTAARASTPVPAQGRVVAMPSPTSAARAELANTPATVAVEPGGGSPSAGPPGLDYTDIGPETTWGEIFSALSQQEQTCIRDELGDEQVGVISDLPLNLETLPGLNTNSVMTCISDEAASEIAVAEMSRQFGGIDPEEAACLRELMAEIPIRQLVEAEMGEPSAETAMLQMSYGIGLLQCLPGFAEQAFDAAQEGTGPGVSDGAGDGEFSLDDPTRLWRFSTGGWTLTAPAVVDGVVYAGSDDHSLYALEAESGNLIWSFATGDVIRSTPTVADGRVFFGSNDNRLYALDATTGAELWRRDTGDWVQYSPVTGHGKVYFAAYADGDRRVHAVNGATGEVVWTAEHPFPIGADLAPAAIGDRVYAQGAEYGQFYALDAATGELAWQAEVGGYVESSPAVLDGVVYLTVANRAYAFNEFTGKLIWEVNTEEFPARDFPALVVDGIYYLAPGSNVYGLDAATGEELWSYESFMLSTEPVVVNGVLYGASGDSEYIFALDARTGTELWTETTEDFTTHSLMVVDGVLYGELGEGYLFAVETETGRQVWGLDKGGFSDVKGYTVADGVVYFGGVGNDITAHSAPEGW